MPPQLAGERQVFAAGAAAIITTIFEFLLAVRRRRATTLWLLQNITRAFP
jgi:hypothetical protein